MKEQDKYVQIIKTIDFNKKKNRAKVHKLLDIYGSVENIPVEFLQSKTIEKYNPERHKNVKPDLQQSSSSLGD